MRARRRRAVLPRLRAVRAARARDAGSAARRRASGHQPVAAGGVRRGRRLATSPPGCAATTGSRRASGAGWTSFRRRHEAQPPRRRRRRRAICSARLERAGRLANTLIVFTSDNGLMWGEHRWTDMKSHAVRGEHPRSRSSSATTPSASRRASRQRLATNLDLAPTFADARRSERARRRGPEPRPAPRRTSGAAWRSEILLEHLRGKSDRTRNVPTYCGVRTDRWKYVAYSTHEDELYDLERDPAELSSLASSDAHRSRLLDLRRDVRRLCDPLPPGLSLEWLCTHEPSGSGSIAIGSSLGDTFCGSARADTLSGGEGDDVLFGRAGRDRARRRARRRRVLRRLRAATGSRPGDGTRDVIVCGPGRDIVFADLLDGVGRGCEVVRRGA